MFQTFHASARPEQGPPRLAALREEMRVEGLAGFLVPRADAYQGEYVADCDARLQWLTGFTGSAGFCIVLDRIAGVFIDGRYRTQVKAQVDLAHFTPVPWPEMTAGDWIKEQLFEGDIGFDPWLHTAGEIAKIEAALAATELRLRPVSNLVDRIWEDRPAPPREKAFAQPLEYAGRSAAEKCREVAGSIAAKGAELAVLTSPDSICWLLNIRGADIPRNPLVQAFALVGTDAKVTLFVAEGKIDAQLQAQLGAAVTLRAPEHFAAALRAAKAKVLVDRGIAPLAVSSILEETGSEVIWGEDPCRLPKARKNSAEIDATRRAHLRDGAAVCEFLAWLDREAPGDLTEIRVVEALEGFRRAANQLRDISFDTICGAGPNGAIIHYRVTHETDRKLQENELLLVDSGAQYQDGTTDITRTIAIGDPGDEARLCYTAVLRGMIAVSRLRWPRGLSGRDLDAVARFPLWALGRDYDHGTGHGVGVYLSVHEGPQRLSRLSEVPLEEGMILSNEPGYYREGAFGIRLENLVVVQEALKIGDQRDQLSFETLTFAPFDRRLILVGEMARDERDWLNHYHRAVFEKIAPLVSAETRLWLEAACQPI